jgi:hypothetical protein
MGLEDHVDLRRRFDQWGRDRTFGRYELKPAPIPIFDVDVGDAIWGDDPSLRGIKTWVR